MVEQTRMEQLVAMLKQDPHDDFTRYAYALELKKMGQFDESLEQFDQLIQQHSDYVPAYFMSGQLLVEIQREEEAVIRLKQGIQAAQRTNDQHAMIEMQEFLESIGSM